MRRGARAGAIGLGSAALIAALAHSQRWIHDDGFINLRIVQNVVAGHGPVFNVGERVEAGTSPLWLGLLSIVHGLGAPLEWGAVVAGITCMALAVALLALPSSLASARTRAPLGYSVPVGFLVFASVRPVWEYASSGLETSLSCLWIAASSTALVAVLRRSEPSRGARAATAFLFGLGPLVRPDYAMYSALFLTLLAWHGRRRGARASLGYFVVALALPAAVQVLRMGYFGTFAPNTALAKEAFRLNLGQGRCYLNNFLGTYRLGIPLVSAAWLGIRHVRSIRKRCPAAALALTAPPVAATLHAAYVVAIGGDYMHARLLLPDLLAFLVPAALVALPRRLSLRDPRPAVAVGIVLLWAPTSTLGFHVRTENQCGIGDEHGWYVREAQRKNPVLVHEYASHPFYKDREPATSREASQKVVGGDHPRPLVPFEGTPKDRALLAGAIGIVGLSLPSTVHVIDRHGLAEPVAARFRLERRGRPGHEKELSPPWVVARYAAPDPSDESDVLAARRALSCGALAELVTSVTAPLTAARFAENLTRALSRHTLRFSGNPFVAAAELCDGTSPRLDLHGGPGGAHHLWMCAEGQSPTGLRARFDEHHTAFVSIALACSQGSVGRTFGEKKHFDVELECPRGTTVQGFYGHADTWVHELGLFCGNGTTSMKVTRAGASIGTPFESTCTNGEALGLAARVGDLVDAMGTACLPARPPRSSR